MRSADHKSHNNHNHLPNHLLLTIDPRDSNSLKEHSDKHGISSRVSVQELEEVEAALGTGCQAHEEVECEEARHEDFTVATDRGKLVTKSCYYGFRSTELKSLDNKSWQRSVRVHVINITENVLQIRRL